MIEKLIRGLAAGSDLTAEEILDVLWLSAIRAGPQDPAEAAAPEDRAVPAAPSDQPHPERERAAPTADPLPLASAGEWEPEAIPVRLPTDAAVPGASPDAEPDEARGERIPGTEVGFGAPRPIRDAAGLPRALRRLRQVRRPGLRLAVDVEATVAATADAGGTLVPVFTRPPERALDLALVVDGSPEMRIWDDTFDEFARLMAQAGAFRSVERWRLIVDGGVSLADASGKVQPPERLIDPSGRRVVFVATSASADAWYSSGPWETIASWCAAMPTALIQVLPRQYWAGTALGEPYVTVRADRPAAPNGEYTSRLAWWADDACGVPLPVVTLAPDALATWAQAAVTGTAWAPAITATPPDPGYAPSDTSDLDAHVLVNDFLSRASPGAERLACILATASALSMPLIAVLQESLASGTGVLELAEVLSSGLLTEDGAAGQPLFRFRDDTRQILQRGVTTFEEWNAYEAVSAYLESRPLLGGPLHALIPDPDGSAELDPADEPFAALHESLATRLGLRSAPDAQGTASQPTGSRESPAIPTPAGLLDLLVDEISRLRGEDDFMTVAAFGAAAVELYKISRDQHGTPVHSRVGALPVVGLQENELFYIQLRALLHKAGDRKSLFVKTAPNDLGTELAMTVASGILANENLLLSASVHEYEADIPLAISEAIARSPLCCSYQLAVFSRRDDGEFYLNYEPLFLPGDVRGDRRSARIKCQPSDENGTVFAVLAPNYPSLDYGYDNATPVVMVSAKVAPGIYDLTAELLAPGAVRFHGLPVETREDARPWSSVKAAIPGRIDMAGPVHLILVIETNDPNLQMAHRLAAARTLIRVAESTGAQVSVSIVLYGWQATQRSSILYEFHGTQEFSAPDDGSLPVEDQPLFLAWTADSRQALDTLSGAVTVAANGQDGTLRRAFSLIADRLGDYEPAGRPVLVTIGTMVSSSEWIRPVNRLIMAHPGIALGAIPETGADVPPWTRAKHMWQSLGRNARASSDDFNVREFATDLGLLAPTSTPLPFPLSADFTITVDQPEIPPLSVTTADEQSRLAGGREYRIGRDPASDFPLSNARVSWNHAVLRTEGLAWVLEDVGSRNGTFLDGERVTRLEITSPYRVHFGHPEDGPWISCKPLLADPSDGEVAPTGTPVMPPPDPRFLPGVFRAPTERIRFLPKITRIGRRPDNDIVVSDLMVSRQHAELRRSSVSGYDAELGRSPAVRYSVVDLGSHHGTFVNGARVSQAEVTEDDIIGIGHAMYRLSDGDLIEYLDEGRAALEAYGLRVVVTSGGTQKVLLDGITFPLAARTMMAVVGPAGAGKTTLLNALTGSRPATYGRVYYDFRDFYAGYDEFQNRIGLVPREYSPYNLGGVRSLGLVRRLATSVRQFTPRTALGYAARVRFAGDVSEAERDQRVGEVLVEASLAVHADTRIDRLLDRDKKYVDLGLALLARPTLLFLDEPTLPMAPPFKRMFFEHMHRIADPSNLDGRSVIMATSDAESSLLDFCDHLLVLAPGGKMAYFGPPREALPYFGQQDWADVFERFAAESDRDFAAEFRTSPGYATYVAGPMRTRAG